MTLNIFLPNFLSYNPKREQLISAFEKLLAKDIQLYTNEEAEADDYHVLVSGRPTEEHIQNSSNLNSLIIPWAGLPVKTAELMKNYPQVAVHNLHHNAAATAETALSLLFSAAKQTHIFDARLRKNNWGGRSKPETAVLLSGKTMLVLGFGSIGRHTAKVGLAMGMEVKGIRRTAGIEAETGVQCFSMDSLGSLLPETNVLMIALPHTPETDGLIGEEEISLLKDPAILVNVGRGPIVQQQALYQALKSGKLAGAGIDVWYNYPKDDEEAANTPPSDYPLQNFENIVFSPHRGGGSSNMDELRIEHLAAMLNAAARGEQMPNKVDLQAGY